MEIISWMVENSLANINHIILSENKCGLIVDPFDGDQVSSKIEQYEIRPAGILVTHEHFDHTRGVESLQKKFSLPVLSYENWQTVDLAESLGLQCGLEISVFPVPGHTLGHIAFRIQEQNRSICFLGDTLFRYGVGNCSNGGDPVELFKTIMKLSEFIGLEDNLYFAHDYAAKNREFALDLGLELPTSGPEKQIKTTLGREKQESPFYNLDRIALLDQTQKPAQKFAQLRAMRDRF